MSTDNRKSPVTSDRDPAKQRWWGPPERIDSFAFDRTSVFYTITPTAFGVWG